MVGILFGPCSYGNRAGLGEQQRSFVAVQGQMSLPPKPQFISHGFHVHPGEKLVEMSTDRFGLAQTRQISGMVDEQSAVHCQCASDGDVGCQLFNDRGQISGQKPFNEINRGAKALTVNLVFKGFRECIRDVPKASNGVGGCELFCLVVPLNAFQFKASVQPTQQGAFLVNGHPSDDFASSDQSVTRG